MQIAGRFIFPRRDTAEGWTQYNPTLGHKEPGLELSTDGRTTLAVKIGDGLTAWVDLPYAEAEDVLDLIFTAIPKAR